MPTKRIGTAVETNTAGSLGRTKTRVVGTAVETDTAGAITAVGGAPAAALMVVGYRMMTGQPPPEPGYDLMPQPHDVVGGAIVFGIAVAALYASVRAFVDAAKKP